MRKGEDVVERKKKKKARRARDSADGAACLRARLLGKCFGRKQTEDVAQTSKRRQPQLFQWQI